MEKIALASEARELGLKLSLLRNAKRVPAVVYGHGIAPAHVSIDNSEFLKTYRKAGGTHLVDLKVAGKNVSVLIHEVQKHPVTGAFLHIDFFAVSAKEKIHVQVPVVLVGKSQAVVEGGELIQNVHVIDVKVLPGDLVDSIEVDISGLEKIDDIIHVESIVSKYPKLEILTPLGDAIISARAPKEQSDELQTADVADVATVQEEKAAEKAAE